MATPASCGAGGLDGVAAGLDARGKYRFLSSSQYSPGKSLGAMVCMQLYYHEKEASRQGMRQLTTKGCLWHTWQHAHSIRCTEQLCLCAVILTYVDAVGQGFPIVFWGPIPRAKSGNVVRRVQSLLRYLLAGGVPVEDVSEMGRQRCDDSCGVGGK